MSYTRKSRDVRIAANTRACHARNRGSIPLRPVMALKTRHDGDCHIYGVNGICTCGFFHDVIGMSEEPADFEEKHGAKFLLHNHNIDWLSNQTVPPPRVLSPEEKAEIQKLLEKMFKNHNSRE